MAKTLNTNTVHYNIMVPDIIFSKRIRSSAGTLVISIPPEIIEYMELSDGEMVEVCLTKKRRVQETTSVPEHMFVRHNCDAYILSDEEVSEAFR